MCLLIFAHRMSPNRPLVLAANRDEFHARPTAPAQFWSDHPDLLAGRDLEQGGTWMGVTRQGRFAAITNFRDPSRTAPAPRSRGELPIGYLTGSQSPPDFMQQMRDRSGEYAGFNLLLGDGEQLWYLTNSGEEAGREPYRLEPGYYGLSNAQLDTPWPKVIAGKHKLRSLLEGPGEPDHESLARVVAGRDLADPKELELQGLDGDMDQLLSAQFIVSSLYGTRSTTTLWRNDQGRTHWQELTYDQRGALQGTQVETF
jgi:uncharacterized protein with NRDE domain